MRRAKNRENRVVSWVVSRIEGIQRDLGWSFWVFLGVFVWIGFVAFWPEALLGGASTKWWNILEFVMIYAILALGLNLVVGYMGLLDLGYVTFLATGAVVTSMLLLLTVNDPADRGEGGGVSSVAAAQAEASDQAPGWVWDVSADRTGYYSGPGARKYLFHFPGGYLVILLISGGICALIGLLRGIPTLKLTGDYYAIVTLGIAEIVYLFYYNEAWLTGGPFGIKFKAEQLPSLFGEKLYYDTRVFFLLLFVCMLLAVVASYHLRLSRVGRAWSAIRLDETAARSVGIDISFYKMLGFGISGFMGGIGGGLFAVWLGTVAVKDLDVWQSILILCGAVLGGLGSIRGVLLGTAILISLRELLKDPIPFFGLGSFRVPPEASFLVYGLLLILLMRFRPQGLIPSRATGRVADPAARLKEVLSGEGGHFALVGKGEVPGERRIEEEGGSETILSVEHFSKFFGGVHAVEDVTMKIAAGSVTSLIGPNGAGKTTLFNGITGIFPPTSGRVIFAPGGKPRSITGMRSDEICFRGIARTFQNIRLFHDFTVLENVKIGLHARTESDALSAVLRLPSMRREETAVTRASLGYLDFVGLAGYANELAGNLSYGNQRKLEIARALATRPSLLLLDEPAAGMNPAETEELMRLIEKIRGTGITVLLIEHDMKLVMNISDYVYVLDHGQLISQGAPEEVSQDPKVIEAYLGTSEGVAS